jgi:hypothetical protein
LNLVRSASFPDSSLPPRALAPAVRIAHGLLFSPSDTGKKTGFV